MSQNMYRYPATLVTVHLAVHAPHITCVKEIKTTADLRLWLCCCADNAVEGGEGEADRPIQLTVLALLGRHKDGHPRPTKA